MGFSYNKILNIPDSTILQTRVTKVFFLRNFDLSAAEKRLLNNDILQMEWLASLRLDKCNIPPIVTNETSFEEIQVICCTVKDEKLNGLVEKTTQFFQKHIPYPVLLIVEDSIDFVINVAEKRINQTDRSKRIIQRQLTTPVMPKLYKTEKTDHFFKALSFENLNKTNLQTAYGSYTQAIANYQIATVSGTFNARARKRTSEDMERLREIEDLQKDIVGLTSQIKKENQLNVKVTLNINIQRKRQTIKNLLSELA